MSRNKRTIKLMPGGPDKEVTVVGVATTNEHWNDYLLEDGSALRLKVVVTEVYRVDGEYDGDGNPIYIIRSSNIVTVNAQENMRRKS